MLFFLFLLVANSVFSQVKTEKVSIEQIPISRKTSLSKLMVVEIPSKEFKIRNLETNLVGKELGKDELAFGIFTDFYLDLSQIKGLCKNGFCYKEVEVLSEGSNTLGFVFKSLHLSENSELFIINDDESYIQGPYTKSTVNIPDNFISGLMPGEKLRILLKEPYIEQNKSKVVISQVSHGILDFFAIENYKFSQSNCIGFGCSAICNENIICHQNHTVESLGVALMLRKSENTYFAHGTGTLINNGKQDFDPILLTAIHVSSTILLEDMQFMFHYRSPQCSPTLNSSTNITIQGAKNLTFVAETDLKLIKLDVNPYYSPVFANNPVSYLGWSIVDQNIPYVTGIHHSLGDVQKFMEGSSPSPTTINNNYFWETQLTNGLLEIIASGSPIFDQNKRIIGANHGRRSGLNYECDNPDSPSLLYGRLSRSWYKFSEFLDPENEGIVAMNTITNQAEPKIFSEISGSDQLCSTNSYTVLNSPLDATITWTATPSNLFSTSTGTGKIANLSPATASSSGTGTLTFTFTQNGESWYVSKNITVGSPKINMGTYSYNNNTQPTQPYISIINNVVCDLYTPVSAEIPIEAGISNFHNLQILHVSNPSLTYNVTFSDDLATIYFDFWDYGQEIIFRLTTQNDCGSDFKDFAFRSEQCYGYLSDYKVYPNPASDVLNIEIN
ncbi:hypothetical protein ACFOUP_04080 [Belliella kenyensis]|uniref:Uncharacterized protein n=1 Tax=Belliella kenyensis TaxID=1472724 RepID=A0ABV8EKL1_9BACT|nr:hypothetical protein [Belliella kenyensis]MCH7403084.1 hypothetical protein [Belliella kenyensis]MDN3602253.1 hypothetical protein [Belliella kenyensis]